MSDWGLLVEVTGKWRLPFLTPFCPSAPGRSQASPLTQAHLSSAQETRDPSNAQILAGLGKSQEHKGGEGYSG